MSFAGWAGLGADPCHLDANTQSILFLTGESDQPAQIGFSMMAGKGRARLTMCKKPWSAGGPPPALTRAAASQPHSEVSARFGLFLMRGWLLNRAGVSGGSWRI